MDHISLQKLLKKYTDNIPCEIGLIYENYLNGDIDTIKYISNLNKHDKSINERNINQYNKTRSRIIYRFDRPDNRYDDNYISDRANYSILSDKTTYFVGFF